MSMKKDEDKSLNENEWRILAAALGGAILGAAFAVIVFLFRSFML